MPRWPPATTSRPSVCSQQARGDFWEGSSDRVFLQDIDLAMLLNEDIDWENDGINFGEPRQFPQISGGQFFAVYRIEVYRDSLDEWLKAHPRREPAKSHDKGTDVTSEAAGATRPPPSRRRGGGPKPGPYLVRLEKFLTFRLKEKGPGYFDSIGAVEKDVRNYFARAEFKGRVRLPTSRSGLQDQIKKWKDENVHLD